MSGLWQPGAGRVGKPKALAVVPQQPLVPTANLSLLSMLTYPAELDESEWDEATAVLLPFYPELLSPGVMYSRHPRGEPAKTARSAARAGAARVLRVRVASPRTPWIRTRLGRVER